MQGLALTLHFSHCRASANVHLSFSSFVDDHSHSYGYGYSYIYSCPISNISLSEAGADPGTDPIIITNMEAYLDKWWRARLQFSFVKGL